MPIAPYPPKLPCCQACGWKGPIFQGDVLYSVSRCPKCSSDNIKIEEANSWDLVKEWFKS